MLAERGFQSIALGQQAREFIAWSKDTGATLSRMYGKSLPKALEIAHVRQNDSYFPHGDLSVLHQRDWFHHPAVLIARKRSKTYIQNLPPLITGIKERYAHITQVGRDNIAVGLSITRTLPTVPDGIVITFGRHSSYPEYEGIHGTGLIHVSETGETRSFAPKRTSKYMIEEQIHTLMQKLMHGVDATKDPYVQTMSRIGAKRWDAN